MQHSILQCNNIIQLSEFVSHMVPKIWTGTPFFMTTDRSNCFKLFCQNIIKATQISSSCILVALFYLYRLRFAYPSIRGSMGSEVRLFTTALVLANKFLDDNTFTNKTWSEISSVPLHELNIMEMEFLSALQYRTCVHHVQFFSWTSQCQQWMQQLVMPTLSHPIRRKSTTKIKKRTTIMHPYNHNHHRTMIQSPAAVLSWTSNKNNATTIATVAAATAMNVNYPFNFIPRRV